MMEDNNIVTEEEVLVIDSADLDPIVIAPISEATGSGGGGTGDFLDQMIWGDF
jgi:hypothetical protein